MRTRGFWIATTERVLVTFVVTLVSALGIGAEAFDISQLRWGQALGIAAGAGVLSLVKCFIAGLGVGPKGSPSLVRDPAAANLPDDPGAEAERLAKRDRRIERAGLDPGPLPGAHRRVRPPGDD